MNGITPEDTRKFATHLHSYFLTLGNVLDDLNFKVVALCLDVLRLTLEKVGPLLAPYTQVCLLIFHQIIVTSLKMLSNT